MTISTSEYSDSLSKTTGALGSRASSFLINSPIVKLNCLHQPASADRAVVKIRTLRCWKLLHKITLLKFTVVLWAFRGAPKHLHFLPFLPQDFFFFLDLLGAAFSLGLSTALLSVMASAAASAADLGLLFFVFRCKIS